MTLVWFQLLSQNHWTEQADFGTMIKPWIDTCPRRGGDSSINTTHNSNWGPRYPVGVLTHWHLGDFNKILEK